MTFKALSNIIKKHKEQEPTPLPLEGEQREREIAEARTAIETLRTNHKKAFEKRKAKWEQEHPGKEFYERAEVDDRKDCILDEWFFDFFQRVHASNSPEVRYRLERNPDHGFGHDPIPN